MIRRLCWSVAIVSLAVPASAQTTFNPVFNFGAFYTDNFTFVGTPGGDKASSGYYLGLALPVNHQIRDGSITAMYSTSYESFSDVQLDNGIHYLNFALTRNRSKTDRLSFYGRYNYTQDQGNRRSLSENQLFLSPRATREFGSIGINYAKPLSKEFAIRLIGRASSWRYGNFVLLPEQPTPRGFRDRDAFAGGFGVSKRMGRDIRLGMAYGYRHFELSQAGTQDINSLSLTFSYRVGNAFTLGLAAGGFNRTSTSINNEQRKKSGFQLALNIGKAWRLESLVIGVRVAHAPNVGGGAQVGTATVSRAGLFIRPGVSRGRRNWSWSLFANWARRDPVNNIQKTIENVSVGGSFYYGLGRILGISISANYVDQVSQSELNRGEFFRASLGLSIRPLGWTPIARP